MQSTEERPRRRSIVIHHAEAHPVIRWSPSSAAPAGRLLLVCDARQTPDRGSIGLIAELSRYAGTLRVALSEPTARAPLWIERLVDAGVARDDIETDLRRAINWIGSAQS